MEFGRQERRIPEQDAAAPLEPLNKRIEEWRNLMSQLNADAEVEDS